MKNNGMIFDAIIGCSAVFGVALQCRSTEERRGKQEISPVGRNDERVVIANSAIFKRF